jgi:acyl carrier protein
VNSATLIKGFVEDYLKKVGRPMQVTEKTQLLSNSDLDSLLVIELTIFIEDKFGLNFQQRPIERSHLSTLGSLIEFVDEAKSGKV